MTELLEATLVEKLWPLPLLLFCVSGERLTEVTDGGG